MQQYRNYGEEIDGLRSQLSEMQQRMDQLNRLLASRSSQAEDLEAEEETAPAGAAGKVYYAGHYSNDGVQYRWEPQERRVGGLLALDGEKAAKILAALGHKQRLDILLTLLEKPQTGVELVERFGMGTTGQLYHHTKALAGADLLKQEERGGAYSVAPHRALPLLVLLAAVSDLLDAGDYMAMTETRSDPARYFGQGRGKYDPHPLLWAVLENAILEHRSGHCSEVHLYLHDSRRATVSDNGRGIPLRALSGTGKTWLQTVMTDLEQLSGIQSAAYSAPGSEKGIGIAVVNALSLQLHVEVRRGGTAYRQIYRHGIPQSEPLPVGATRETGTGITLEPDPELFEAGFDPHTVRAHIDAVSAAYPDLTCMLH